MNKTQLIDAVAARTELPKTVVSRTIDATLKTIVEAVSEDDKVAIVDFGNFEKKVRAARSGRNPQTGALIQIAETMVPIFKAGKSFKEAMVNTPEVAEI